MPIRAIKQDSGQVATFRPLGKGGVDLLTDATQLDPETLSRSENIDFSRMTAERRKGAIKLARSVDPTTVGKSYTFGATTKYATFTPPLIPAGGWADVFHFNMVYPSGGNTAWVVGAKASGGSYHVRSVTISDAGVITSAWTDSGATARSVATSAVANGTDVHLFSIYDPVAGTYTVYVNGSSSGTPLTGLASTLKPAQDASVTWTFGVEKETGAAVTANTNFDGKLDGWTLFSLRGQRAASGTTTLAETLRRHSARTWPTPQMKGFVLAHYDMDEASGTVMYDRSEEGNNGTYVGSPSVTDPMALLSAPCNHVGWIDVPNGRFNVAGHFGNLFYERMSSAV